MTPATLTVGDIVQLDPATCRSKAFAGCMMVIEELRPWGAMGYITPIGERLDMPPMGVCYYRALWEEMEPTGGRVVWRFSDVS